MENYKTIRQIATETGVVRQTIHKYINTEPLKSLLNNYIKYLGKGNKIYIHTDGIELIRKYLIGDDKDEKDVFEDDINTNGKIEDAEDKFGHQNDDAKDCQDDFEDNKDNVEINEYSKKYIKMLESQIEEKDKIIAELSKSIFNFSQSINADKQNELVENIKPNLIEAVSSKRNIKKEKDNSNQNSGFFKKLFRKKEK
jgi:hypothetical protein